MRFSFTLALSLWATLAHAEPQLIETSRLILPQGDAQFGGLSGIELDATGRNGWIISDYGKLFAIEVMRDDEGSLTGLKHGPAQHLQRPYRDIPLSSRADTEGVAVLPGGALAVSLERPARIWLFAGPDSKGQLLAPHYDLGILLRGAGLEALAADAKGRLLAIPEHKLRREDPMFPVLRVENGQWEWVANLPQDGPFLPVGADFGADGLLYLLERAASPLGFRSRVRRLNPEDPNPTPEILLQSTVGQYDNLEGLSVWQNPNGVTHVTLISDDNFLSIQRREVIEFRLQE